MKVRLIGTGVATVAILVCWTQDASAFGRRGNRGTVCHQPMYHSQPMYYCPPVYCPPAVPNNPSADPNNPSPSEPATPDTAEQRPLPKLSDVPADVTDPVRPKS